MEKLKNAVDGLIAALAGTEAYRDYMRAKERIAPSQMEQIDSYKRLRGSLMSDYSAENAARVREMGRRPENSRKTIKRQNSLFAGTP